MPAHEIYQILTKAMWALFAFAFGACVGSLINVVVYRLPRGIGIVTPGSSCPSCETKLTWRENIPIFGWLLLRGRCRFCKSRISPEYPIVETVVAFLFALLYAAWYLLPPDATLLGTNIGQLRPEWTIIDLREMWPRHTWPTFLVVLALVGSLVAMTIVDAKSFMIPAEIPWFATVFALVVHTVHAFVVERTGVRMPPLRSGEVWFIPAPDTWNAVLTCIGAVAGCGVGVLLLRFGLIRRSFADYDEWEKQAMEAAAAAAPAAPDQEGAPGADPAAGPDGGPDMWIQYPHARREVLKEVIFLTPCVVLGYAGWMVGGQIGASLPLWMQVLGGVLLGYLVGGAVVWVTRILGSLGFGKEAMGLGDVHLMAAVGAALGWIDAIIAFFGAAFVGLAWTLLGLVFKRKISRMLPYGPYLAVSTILVILFKPLIYHLLRALGIFIP